MSGRENPYRAPEHDAAEVVAGVNRTHTTLFGVLLIMVVFGTPWFFGALIGLLMAPILGAAVWGLYRLTLPRGPQEPSIAETAGSVPCPSCRSVQTDRRQFSAPGQPPWRCFGCGHEW
jgi:MFS superfamily sulfate permease-like transporter